MQETPIEVRENNKEKLKFTIVLWDEDNGEEDPYDLTGSTQKFYIKASADAADGAAVAQTGSGITVDSATGGKLTVTVPASNHATPGDKWYRLDVIPSGETDPDSVAFGLYRIKNL